ncbi:hypothetical protein THAOC_01202 [Thalassiosira oceanica]|uniref:ATPase AAA-type core domain-containing protein n=1 Tax=Thalassiosira oceanica TaxID=159749 RepID=K0THP1_THAOC|nr:hypothetical protein THAOC_01202 [Thalassiosira oceanica]|eukprot:EJK76995.1 hypothetical protein THAOC_01202 [Thalassiosira oceanica]
MSNGNVASGDNTVQQASVTVKQKRWVCDVCKVKWFLDYADACAHEKKCTGPPPPQKCKLAPDANLPGGTEDARDRKVGPESEISTNSIGMEERSGWQHQQAGNTSTHRGEGEGSSDNADEEESNRAGSESSGNASKRKSKRLRDVSKLRQQQMQAREQPEKKTKKTKKAGKSGKSTSKEKSKGKAGGGQIASIFMPQRKPISTTASSAGTESKDRTGTVKQEIPAGVTEEEYEEHVAAEKVAARKGRTEDPPIDQRVSQRRNRRKIVESDSEGDFLSESDVEEVKIIEPKSKRRRCKTANKNDCFLSTKAKAEHQAADFFAKRRALQAEERERQKKRDEIKLARLGTSSSKATDGARPSPTKRAPAPVRENSLEAIRFPCPSHIVPGKDAQDLKSSESSSAHRLAPKYQHAKPDLSTPGVDDSDDRLGFYTAADQIEDKGDNFAFDLLSSLFNASTNKADPKDAGQIWPNKYAASSIPDDILGEKNKVKAQKLLDFIEEWKVKRHQSMESLGQLKRKKKRRKKKKSGYDTDDSFLDDDRLESIMIITGQSATGKTALVHSAAEQADCAVIEINSSDLRSGQALRKAIQETTQSHSNLAMAKKKGGGNGANLGKIDEEGSGVDSDDDGFEYEDDSVAESHPLAVILLDEGEPNIVLVCELLDLKLPACASPLAPVDLLFEEDTAFWLALGQVRKKAKCPIILTATSFPDELANIRHRYVNLERPSAHECAIKMAEVFRAEGMQLPDDASLGHKLTRLSAFAEFFHCDLRKIFNEMQLFCSCAGWLDPRGDSLVELPKFDPLTSLNEARTQFEDLPIIRSITPRIVSRENHTLVTIQGEHFLPLDLPKERTELFIGGKKCSHFKVICAEKIVAVCPPCELPEGVSNDAIYEDALGVDCLSAKYARVLVRRRSSNGLVLASSSVFDLGQQTDLSLPRSTQWNIEYDIPLRDERFEERTLKNDLKRRAEAQKVRDDLADFDEDSDDASDKPAPKPRREILEENNGDGIIAKCPTSSQVDNPAPAPATDPGQLLDDALAELNGPETAPKQEGRRKPFPDNSFSLQDCNKFAHELGSLSDVAYLEGSMLAGGVPYLSGSVEGFGSNMFDVAPLDSMVEKLTKDDKRKPPSFEAIYSAGLNESEFFFGNSDCYFTTPQRPRERNLLSRANLFSRGLGHIDCASVVEDEEDPVGISDENSNSMFSFVGETNNGRSSCPSEDDLYLSFQPKTTMEHLPSLLAKNLLLAKNHGFSRVLSPAPALRREQSLIKTYDSILSVIGQSSDCYFGLRHCVASELPHTDPILDEALSLDYAPYLRGIAFNEIIAREKVKQLLSEGNGGASKARRTRREALRARRSYIEEYLVDERESLLKEDWESIARGTHDLARSLL